uniref:G_PROTEIN_RECEP_F2_4 domain-containing protein n=1 Tax=Macrostomum lignano TaxID=282301 RepID=A0A1I8FSZ9_9PLAT
ARLRCPSARRRRTVLNPLTGFCETLADLTGQECRQLAEPAAVSNRIALAPPGRSDLARLPAGRPGRMLSGFAKSQPFRDLGPGAPVRQPCCRPTAGRRQRLRALSAPDSLADSRPPCWTLWPEFAAKACWPGPDAPESEAEFPQPRRGGELRAGPAWTTSGGALQFGTGRASAPPPVSVQRLRPDGTQLVRSADRSSTVKLRLLPDSAQGTAVSMVTTVLNLPHLTRRLGTAKQPVVSNVIQATYAASSGQPAAEVLLLIPHSRISGQLRHRCLLAPEFLSPSGCRVAVELSSPTVTACLCRHLSSFAVTVLPGTAWLGVETHRLWRLHSEPLRILTWICLSVSIVCLLLTSITYIVVRMQTPMADKSIATLHRVHRSLCLALMLGQALFLAAFQPLDATPIAACKLLSVLTLYALLCAFCWLLCEGLMYTHSLVKFWHYCLASGVAPLLIVLPTAALRPEQLIQTEADASADSGGLLRPSVCWLSGDHGVSFAFIGPAMAVCLVNLCLFAVIMRRLAGTRSDAADAVGGSAATSASLRLSYLSRQMKVTATLACLLGLTWLLGLMFLFAETHLFIVAQYLFTLLNGLQGCFIFATQVCAHKRVREDWEKFLIDGRRTPGSLRRLLEQRRNARLSAPGSGSTPANKAQQGRLRQPLLPRAGAAAAAADRRQQSSRRPQQLESGFFDSRAFGDTRLDDQSLFDITHSQAEPALRSPKSPLPEPPPIDTLPARCPGSRELLYDVTDTQASSEYLVPDCKPTEQLTKV